MKPELPDLHRQCLKWISRRHRDNPISYKDIAVMLGVNGRKVRQAVEELVITHHMPICCSYNSRNPGYYWPLTRGEIADTCGRYIKQGVALINRAKAIGKYSEEEVMGQAAMFMKEGQP